MPKGALIRSLVRSMHLRALVVVLALAALLLLASPAAATFRKPPFNGSIFGKRGSPDQPRSMAGECGASVESTKPVLVASRASRATTPQESKAHLGPHTPGE